jgi:outer membrane PBP1 activator LpoA protein
MLQGNMSLMTAVILFALLILSLHGFHWIPVESEAIANPVNALAATPFIADQKTDQFCDQAIALEKQGDRNGAIELLSKVPLPENGRASARARLLLAEYLLSNQKPDAALEILTRIHLSSADIKQRVDALKMKAEIYRTKGKYGYAIDQYINLEVMPELSQAERAAAAARIQELQDEGLEMQLKKQQEQ